MKIKNIELLNYRNYESLNLEFSDNINIIIGNNGEGKTNILESIYLLSLTKSNRYGVDQDLIKFGKESYKVSGNVEDDGLVKKYGIVYENNKKNVLINNKVIRRFVDYISQFCVISFEPNDLEIVKGSPGDRRNYLNIEISQLYNTYVLYLNDYNKLLKIRNNYLKNMNISGNMDPRLLDVINEKLIEKALVIYKYRFDYIKEINEKIGDVFKKITGLENLRVVYEHNLGVEDYDEEAIKNKLIDKFKRHFKQELMLGNTITGPHRDDFLFSLNDEDMKLFSSQGQQRMAIISFKLCELFLYQKVKKSYPVLLLDDVFSEIDIKKRNKIIRFLKKDIQVIITTTDVEDIDKKLLEKAKIFTIKNGIIKTKGGIKNGK